MRNPRKMKNGGKEIEKREERRNRRRRGQRREKVNTEWEKKERIGAHQERSNKENLSVERQLLKK